MLPFVAPVVLAPLIGFSDVSEPVAFTVIVRGGVPLPAPVATVTVQVVPEPTVAVMLGPVSPVLARTKSVLSTPVTLSLKVTVHCTLVAFVGDAPTRLIDTTVGAALSIV